MSYVKAGSGMSDEVNSVMLAEELGVTPPAVANWIKRGILPEELRPARVCGIPVWQASQVPALKAWFSARPRRTVPAREGRPRAKRALASWQETVDRAVTQVEADGTDFLPVIVALVAAGSRLAAELEKRNP